MTEKYASFDLAKLIGSIFIIGLHASAFVEVSENLNFWFFQVLGRIAIPKFLMVSGFLFFKKESTLANVVRFSKRILFLYAFYFVLNLPVTAYSFFLNQTGSPLHLISNFLIHLFLGSTMPGSWYLVSLLFSAWLALLLKKQNTLFKLLIPVLMSVFCCAFCLYGNCISEFGFYQFITQKLLLPYNSIIAGALFFFLGGVAFAKKDKIQSCKTVWLALGLAISLGLFVLEGCFARSKNWIVDTDCCLTLIPVAIFLISLVLKHKGTFDGSKMRSLSTVNYLSHGIFLYAIGFLKTILNIEINHFLRFAFAVIMCFLTFLVLYFLSKKIDFQ